MGWRGEIGQAVDDYFRWLERRGLSPATIRNLVWTLRPLARALANAGVRSTLALSREAVLDHATELASRDDLDRHSLADKLRAIRRFTRWLDEEGRTLGDAGAALPRIRCLPREPPRHVLSEREVAALYRETTGGEPIALRDRAVLEVLYAAGVRRREARSLEVSDLDLAEGTLTVKRGKGQRCRVVPLPRRAVACLARYVFEARHLLLRRRADTGVLLLNVRGQRLGCHGVGHIVHELARRAGVRRATPHGLRHAIATHLVRAGVPLRHVQLFLGHALLETTAIYTHLAKRDLREAVERAHPRGGRGRARTRGTLKRAGRSAKRGR